MPDPAAEVWNALNSGASPIVVVYYPDLGARRAAVEEVASIASPKWPLHETTTVSDAWEHPDSLVLLIPEDERTVVEDLDGLRDAFGARTRPVVLFLMRDGDGARLLPTTLSLVGWVRGSDVDPDRAADIDEEAERQKFERLTGMTVEAWLVRYRAGEVPADAPGLARTYRALLLERR